MKLVFQKFEHSLELKKSTVNVLRIENRELFSNCAISLANEFAQGVPEPAFFFDEEKELKTRECLFFVGDLLTFDLNDRKIIALVLKKIISMLSYEEILRQKLEQAGEAIEELYDTQLRQLSADYIFENDWDDEKYLKAFGLSVDDAECTTLFEKLRMFFKLAADLFPKKVLAFVNLNTYLPESQYKEILEVVASEELIVLSYETGPERPFLPFENGMFVDCNYLER